MVQAKTALSSTRPPTLAPTAQAALFGLGYFALAWIGRFLSWQTSPFTSLWLPSGLFLAVLLLNPMSRWPLLAAAALAGNLAFDLIEGKPLLLGALFGLGNAAEALLGAFLVLRLLGRRPASDQLRDFMWVTLFAGVAIPMLGGLWGAWAVTAIWGAESFWAVWVTWASGDALGIVLLAPVTLFLMRGGWREALDRPRTARLETLALLLVCVAMAWLIFGGRSSELLNHKYLALPVVLYGAFRLGHVGAFVSVVAVALVAAIFDDPGESMLWVRDMGNAAARVTTLQTYLAVLAFTGGAVAVVMARRAKDQAELARREKQHRLLLESTHAVPFAFDFASDRFTYIGPQIVDMLGYPLEKWGDFESWASLIHPDDRQWAVDYCRGETSHGKDHEFAYRVTAADGRTVWILDTVSVVMGPDGPSGLVGFMRDITAQKKAEEDLRASEEQFRFLVESVGVVVWRGKPDSFIFTYVSPEAANLLGYPVAQWVVDPNFWLDHLHPDDRESCVRHCQEAARKLAPHEFEYRMVAADGRMVWVRDIVNFKVAEGRIAEVVGVLMDITPRREAEEALRASRERLNTIAANAPAFIVQLDPQGRIQYTNRVAEGLTEDALLGSSFASWVPEEHRAEVEAAVAKVFSEGGTLEYRVPGYGSHGELAHYQVRLSPETTGGRVTSAIAMVVDVTERVKAEEERRILETQLRQAQKMEAIGTLASGIAHDFNNILAAIMGFAELAVDSVQSGQDNSQDLKQIMVAARRARDLVRQILTFSRKVEPQRRPMSLNQEIARGVKVLQSTLPKMISIRTRLAPDLNRLNADPGQINQVLFNLATNAAHAMPEGGELVITTESVEVVERACSSCGAVFSGSFARMTVEDSGQGIDPRIMDRLFDPFFTTKEVGQGTGLGLSIVQGIVKSHGGHIECESGPGRGSRFSIYLPALAMEDTPPPPETDEYEPLPGGGETLLLVDDEVALREMASRLLRDRGYRVLSAGSGEEALHRYASPGAEVALVILDLGMPGMGGHKCLQELLAQNPDVKVIIASGYAPADQIKRALAAGAMGYVAKPFRRSELLQTIRRVLDGRPAQDPPSV